MRFSSEEIVMKLPDEMLLISIFECEPRMLDGDKVPFFYNQATYIIQERYMDFELQRR